MSFFDEISVSRILCPGFKPRGRLRNAENFFAGS